MAWTFRKKIKIAPGVHINLSKSGVSTSIGPRGAKVTVGPKGTYLHTGIPGTGLYNRQKIDSGTYSKKSQSSQSVTKAITSNIIQSINQNSLGSSRNSTNSRSSYNNDFSVSIDMDRTGQIKFSFTDYLGRPITDEATTQKLIRKVKASNKYKEALARLYKMTYQEISADTEAFTDLYKKTPKLKTESDVSIELSSIIQKHYVPLVFDEDGPDKESIRQRLISEAEENIRYLFWWKNKAARGKYVEENLPIVYEKQLREWESKRDEFNAKQAEIKRYKDADYYSEYLEDIKPLKAFLSKDEEEIVDSLKVVSNKIKNEVPGSFNLYFDLDSEYGVLYLILDLPEVEEIPKDKAVYLPSGNISFKQKTKKEIQLDYIKCICGLAFFVAGHFFNVNPITKYIQVSGYTQCINKASGTISDDYVYSVFFDKESFSHLNIEFIDPLEAMRSFPCRVKASLTGMLTTITPFLNPGEDGFERGKIPLKEL